MGSDKYGIVIDSGSSGSRIQIYKWQDPAEARGSESGEILASPPKITQEQGWSHKISPGISTYADKTGSIWKQHYKELIEYANTIVPQAQRAETPIYVLATAGMRLLPEKKRDKILKETCRALQKNTDFYVPSCEQIEVIDGETEGMYGWLALNYLMGLFSTYEASGTHELIGFMDMGGASTQIAFVPGPEEIVKHDEDLMKVVLRNVNGQSQEWRVFVETWLGFGANKARSRYLDNLISLSQASSPKSRKATVNDPCMPKGALLDSYTYQGKSYQVQGTGSYEMCIKEIYPLLMKHLPCKDDPCLFNGVHGPKMNFEKDKFVGVSEYWYTANDIFNSGGEYNFHSFSKKVREYCESDYSKILETSKNGGYSGLLAKFLLDACFKASWVINVLHEGFELPRLGVDIDAEETDEMKQVDSVHVPFKSADSVNGGELSWTLGKILLVASAQVQSNDEVAVGIYPSELSNDSDSDEEQELASPLFRVLVLILMFFLLFRFGRSYLSKLCQHARKAGVPRAMQKALSLVRNSSPAFLRPHITGLVNYMELQEHDVVCLDLEAGNAVVSLQNTSPRPPLDLSVLRTRSAINLGDVEDRQVEFFSKPFATPKKTIYNHRLESKESLHRISSTSSMSRKAG